MNLTALLGTLVTLMRSYYNVLHGRVQTLASNVRDHILNTENPHRVTKEQIDLGLVENFPPATREQAVEGIDHRSVMTPRRTREMLEERGLDQINVILSDMADAFNNAADELQ